MKALNVLIVKQKPNDRSFELELLMGCVLAGSSSLSSSVFLLNVVMMFTHLHFYTDFSHLDGKLLTAVVAASGLHVTNI